jgi:hypothetical protein
MTCFCYPPYDEPSALKSVAELGIGFLVLWLSSWPIQWLMDRVHEHAALDAPAGVDEKKWNAAINIPKDAAMPVKWLGMMERALFFLSFWLAAYEIAAGWLAFKVASKWETWQAIMKVPETLDTHPDSLEYLGARNRWASAILQRWMIGTAANGLASFAALGVARLLGLLISGRA